MTNFELTNVFGNRKPRKVSKEDEKRWAESAKREWKREQKEKERTRLKKKTFKVGDKVKVTPWGKGSSGVWNKSFKGVITKLNCRVVYAQLDGWECEHHFDYRSVEKI